MIRGMFISLVVALISGYALVTGGCSFLGAGVDVIFGLSFAMFVGILVAVVTCRIWKPLGDRPKVDKRPPRRPP